MRVSGSGGGSDDGTEDRRGGGPSQVRVHVQGFRGERFLDVREFRWDAHADDWLPTKLSCGIRPSQLGSLFTESLEAGHVMNVDDLFDGDSDHGADEAAGTVVRPRRGGGPGLSGAAAARPDDDERT